MPSADSCRRITLAEVNKLAGEWMTDKNRVLATTSPDKPGIVNPTAGELLLAFDAVKGADIAAYTETAPSAQLVDKDPIGGEVVSERQIKESRQSPSGSFPTAFGCCSNPPTSTPIRSISPPIVRAARRCSTRRFVHPRQRRGPHSGDQWCRQIHRHRSPEISRRKASQRLAVH